MENTVRKSYFFPNILKWTGWVIGGIALAIFLAFIFGYFVMLLWNWLMPTLFGLPVIDFWMAFGIIILSRLIFGSFGHGHPNKSNHHDRFYGSKFRNRCRPPFDKHNKWRYYEDYWKEEGEEAFKRYIENADINKKPAE